jgi:hypothetical protein
MPFGNGIISDIELTNCTIDELGATLGAKQPSEEEFDFMDSELGRLGEETDEAKVQRQLQDLQTEPLFFIEAMAKASDPNVSTSPHKKFNSRLFDTFNSAISARTSEEDEPDWSETETHLQGIAKTEHPDHPSYSPIDTYDRFTSLYAWRAKSALSKPSLQDAVSSGIRTGTVIGVAAAGAAVAALIALQ